jgi:hypothetical protein
MVRRSGVSPATLHCSRPDSTSRNYPVALTKNFDPSCSRASRGGALASSSPFWRGTSGSLATLGRCAVRCRDVRERDERAPRGHRNSLEVALVGKRFDTGVMKEIARALCPPVLWKLGSHIRRRNKQVNQAVSTDDNRFQQQIQRSIVNQYMMLKLQSRVPYENIREAGFRAYSQFEEDGIILYVLSMIGFKTRRVVEMCCGTGVECMATNLILNHGFDGYLFDGDENNIRYARTFFEAQKDCLLFRPTLVDSWITVENVNQLLAQAKCTGEVDLFSLDLDGNDYWVLRAIEAINPRLIVLETQSIIPSEKSIAIPYRPDFSYNKRAHDENFRGASLSAMVKICRERGYRLIGAHRYSFNVFFLRNDVGTEFFPEVSVRQISTNYGLQIDGIHPYWPPVADMPWQTV